MKGCTRNQLNKNKNKAGFSLIEVMITLLVITIGVLGIAGLQSKSLRYNQIAYQHSQAVILANDMIDRVRANKSLAMSSDDYLTDFSDRTFSECVEDDYPAQCATSTCSPSELANYDILQWKFLLACQLPEAQGSVRFEVNSVERMYVVTLKLDDARGTEALKTVELRSGL